MDLDIHTMGKYITKWNAYSLQIIDTLTSWGEINQYLLTNLFKGYGACIDKSFVEYIHQKQELYYEEENTTPYQLMELANTNTLKLK